MANTGNKESSPLQYQQCDAIWYPSKQGAYKPNGNRTWRKSGRASVADVSKKDRANARNPKRSWNLKGRKYIEKCVKVWFHVASYADDDTFIPLNIINVWTHKSITRFHFPFLMVLSRWWGKGTKTTHRNPPLAFAHPEKKGAETQPTNQNLHGPTGEQLLGTKNILQREWKGRNNEFFFPKNGGNGIINAQKRRGVRSLRRGSLVCRLVDTYLAIPPGKSSNFLEGVARKCCMRQRRLLFDHAL